MDHRNFLKSFSAEERAHLTNLSDAIGLIYLLGHLALLVLGGLYIIFELPFWQACLVPYGIALVFLFTLEHECTHRTPFNTRWINDAVGRICGVILILPFEWFRYFHLAHHKYTNDPENDPELATPRPQSWPQLLWYISGVPYWVSMLQQVFMGAQGRFAPKWIPLNAKSRLTLESRLMLFLYFCATLSFLFSDLLFWLWVLPSILAQPFLRIYLLAEHGHCPFVANMFENTRTTFTNRVVRFVAWNMPYHAEHHVYPAVPFWKLPELHRHAKDHLSKTSDGYVEFTAEYCREL